MLLPMCQGANAHAMIYCTRHVCVKRWLRVGAHLGNCDWSSGAPSGGWGKGRISPRSPLVATATASVGP